MNNKELRKKGLEILIQDIENSKKECKNYDLAMRQGDWLLGELRMLHDLELISHDEWDSWKDRILDAIFDALMLNEVID